MPCRDYYQDEEDKSMREHNDLLARVACKAMTELTNNGIADALLLKDDEVREWWAQHQIDDAKRIAEEGK